MKKIALMGLLAFGFTFTACDNYEEPNPPAQSNPQGPVFELDDLTVATSVSASTTYNLEALDASGSNILLATVAAENFPEGYMIGAQAFISNNDFANQYPVTVSVTQPDEEVNEFEIYISPDDLQGVYGQYISKSPKAKEISVRYLLTAEKDAQVAYLGGPTHYYSASMTILPFPSELVIEENYYLIGTIDDWSIAGGVKFEHSDQSPYDDPIFSIIVNVTEAQAADGWWWKIIPQSTWETGEWLETDYSQYGPAEDGTTALTGALMPRLNGADPGAGKFMESGPWKLTINMEDLTYEFSSAVTELYTPGNANGWDVAGSQKLPTTDFINYNGFAYLNGEFKFTNAPNWDGINYGAGAEEGTISTTGGNLSAEEGVYWCSVNIPELTYSLTEITSISMIGNFNGWGGDEELTQTSNPLIWTGTLTIPSGDNGEWKFRMNHDWGINLGGVEADLVPNGGNLISAEGTYTVTLDLTAVPYACTVVKK